MENTKVVLQKKVVSRIRQADSSIEGEVVQGSNEGVIRTVPIGHVFHVLQDYFY